MKEKKQNEKRPRPAKEVALLKDLNVPDFRHISKDVVMSLYGSISEMNPEVAKALAAQLPEFFRVMGKSVGDYFGFATEVLNKAKEGSSCHADLCMDHSKALEAQLGDGNPNLDDVIIVERLRAIRADQSKEEAACREHNRQIFEVGSRTLVMLAFVVSATAFDMRANVGPVRVGR